MSGSPTRRPLRRRDAAHQASMYFGPNMTPMVDVVIVILIFFMSATAFMGPEWFLEAAIPAQTPSTAEGEDPFDMPAPTLRVRLRTSADGTLASGLGHDDVTLDELADILVALGQDLEAEDAFLLIIPAPDVPYPDVVRVRDLCERAGLSEVALSSR